MNNPLATALSTRYIRFADEEVRGRSPLYDTLARAVATDPDAISFLLTLPKDKQQPNLFLASMRHLFGSQSDWPVFRHNLLRNPDAVRSIMLTHSTQTNEPARCATLLPVLASLPQPLAIVEVGASAGLCLLPDRYGYNYRYGCNDGHRLIQPAKAAIAHPVFDCTASRTPPLPQTMPQIVWRAGVDLNPLDPADPSRTAWLETLVWPGQTQRLGNLKAALGIAAADKPRIIKADLRGDGLQQLCREAPRNTTLVIFHTAVLAYVADQAERQAFARRVTSFCDYWISNESPRVFPRRQAVSGRRANPAGSCCR
ncbi:MAG: DUF2332 domain-containing protein [Pseudomonadota bacterium]|nr:DUF2332 domain-containing protein [Pseudomonadota bacterium]